MTRRNEADGRIRQGNSVLLLAVLLRYPDHINQTMKTAISMGFMNSCNWDLEGFPEHLINLDIYIYMLVKKPTTLHIIDLSHSLQ
jgi:hypothetical protein